MFFLFLKKLLFGPVGHFVSENVVFSELWIHSKDFKKGFLQ